MAMRATTTVITRNTTAASSSKRRAAERHLTVLAALLLAATSGAMALPRFQSAWQAAGGNTTVFQARYNPPVAEPALVRAVAGRELANSSREDARYWADLAVLHDRGWRAQAATQAGQHHLLQMAAAATASLLRNPGQPDTWYRLSLARSRLGADREAIAALMQSWATGAFRRELMLARADLGLALRRSMTPVENDRLALAIRQAAINWADRLAPIAELRRGAGFVRESLADHPDLLAEFDRAFLKLRRKKSRRP